MHPKFIISEHLIDTMCVLGSSQGKVVRERNHKAIITGLPSNSYNWIRLGSLDSSLITQLQNENIPFACHPSEDIEEEFESFAQQHGLVKDTGFTAQEFTELSTWEYLPDPKVMIRKVSTEHDLYQFDKIASIAFKDPEGMTAKFLRPALTNPDFALFLASCEGVDAGCGMISLVNGLAGTYWGAVLPEHRKKGIATALTKCRMNFAKEKGFNRVHVQNAPSSINYCRRIGFKPVGAIVSYDFLGK